MKNQITDYLQMSTLEYEAQLFSYYWQWCNTHATCPKQVQKLLANAAVSKWFMYEFGKLENDFCQALPFLIKSKKNLNHEYQAIIGNIYTIYPQPLIPLTQSPQPPKGESAPQPAAAGELEQNGGVSPPTRREGGVITWYTIYSN